MRFVLNCTMCLNAVAVLRERIIAVKMNTNILLVITICQIVLSHVFVTSYNNSNFKNVPPEFFTRHNSTLFYGIFFDRGGM